MNNSVAGKSVSRSIAIYSVAFAVAGGTPFLLLPLLTKYLSPVQFGEVTSFLMLVVIAGNLAGLSSHGFVSVRYFKTDSGKFSGILSTSVAVVGFAHLVVAMILIVTFVKLQQIIGLPLGLTLLSIVAALTLSWNNIFLSVFQTTGQPMLYLRARVIQAAIEVLLCVALIFLFAPTSISRILSYQIALAASVLLGFHHCLSKGYLRGDVTLKDARAVGAFGVPMLPHIAASTAITYLDRAMVSSLLGVDSLGIYMVGMQIGMAMIIVIEPLNKALAPWLFSQLATNDAAIRLSVVKKTYLLYILLVLVGSIIALMAHLFFDLFIGSQYVEAKRLIGWVVAGFVFQGMYYSVVNYLFYAEKTGRLSVMSTLAAFAGGLISYILIDKYGLVGAGISFAVNNCILFLLVWTAASRVVPMPWLLAIGRK